MVCFFGGVFPAFFAAAAANNLEAYKKKIMYATKFGSSSNVYHLVTDLTEVSFT